MSEQTTFLITPETQVPWPCWLWREFSDGSKSWYYYDTGPDFLPVTAKFYSTLPASQRPEEPTISGQVAQRLGDSESQHEAGHAPETPLARACAEAASPKDAACFAGKLANNPQAEIDVLRQINADLEADLTRTQAALEEVRAAEKLVSDAYVRLRTKIPGALKTPHAPTPEQVFATTEAALATLRLAAQEDRERLDWLERNGTISKAHMPQEGVPDCYVGHAVFDWYPTNHKPTPTFRAAIDAARSAPGGKGVGS